MAMFNSYVKLPEGIPTPNIPQPCSMSPTYRDDEPRSRGDNSHLCQAKFGLYRYTRPGKHTKSELENCHRNSELSHE